MLINNKNSDQKLKSMDINEKEWEHDNIVQMVDQMKHAEKWKV